MSSTPRFFVPPSAIAENTVTLPPESAHHAVSVLRLRTGEPLVVHNGENKAYLCHLDSNATIKRATATVQNVQELNTEPETRVTVAQALPKTSDKIEQVLQHGTEIGAAGFVFFTGFRSVARLAESEKVDKRLQRWRGIVQGAAEQSGRGVLPTVAWLPFAAEVAQTFGNYDAVFISHEAAPLPLKTALAERPTIKHLLIVVGPEGGFTSDELAKFSSDGGVPVGLGPRILRTETAALVAVSQILYERE